MSRDRETGRRLMSSAGDSRARTYQAQASAEVSEESGPLFGGTSRPSSSRSVRASSSSRTSRAVSVSGCPRCGEACTCLDTIRWPWGLPPETLVRPIDESECSLLPTPTASSYGNNRGRGSRRPRAALAREHGEARALADADGEGELREAAPQLEGGNGSVYGSLPGRGPWAVEPGVGRVAHGLPGRVDRIRALGNAVVPQCAEIAGRVIVAMLQPSEDSKKGTEQ